MLVLNNKHESIWKILCSYFGKDKVLLESKLVEFLSNMGSILQNRDRATWGPKGALALAGSTKKRLK